VVGYAHAQEGEYARNKNTGSVFTHVGRRDLDEAGKLGDEIIFVNFDLFVGFCLLMS
jgi:hypothetical protein